MGKPRDLANLISTGNPLADGAIAVSEISDLTATAAELNIMDGVTVSASDINSVTSKAPTADPTFTGTLAAPTINASTALQIGGAAITSTATELNLLDGVTATTAELNYVDGVTSAIQTQLDAKASTASPTFSGTVNDGDGKIRAIPQSGSDKTTSYTLVASDVGNFIGIGSGGSITVPSSVFAVGDAVSIFNNTSGDRTITLSISTAYLAGENADKASVTLATRGICTILFLANDTCVVSGNVS